MTQNAKTDIDALNSEAKALLNKLDFAQATLISNKAYNLALKEKYQKGKAEALLTRGNLLLLQQENLQARAVFVQAYKIIETMGDNELLNRIYSSLGIIYGQLSLSEESIKYLTQALDVSKLLKNERSITRDYTNLANALDKFGNNSLAIIYYNKAMKYAIKLSDEHLQAAILTNLSTLHLSKGDFETALKQSFDALEITQRNNVTRNIITIYFNISVCLKELKRFEETENYAKMCHALAIENNISPTIINCELLQAELNILQKKYDETKTILLKIEKMPAFKGNVEAIYKYFSLFLSLYEITGDFKRAYEKQKEFIDFERKQAEINLETKLETQALKMTLCKADVTKKKRK